MLPLPESFSSMDTGSGSQVIESFGEFVVGGNYVVGAIVFGILILIISSNYKRRWSCL